VSAALHNATFARSLAEALARGGVTRVVASPGSRSTPLVLAFRQPAVQLIPVLDERAAGFVALGFARATGHPVALLCTSGSAGGHYLPAVMEADAAGVPLLLITANRPPELQGCGALQTTEQGDLFAGYTRWTRRVGPPDASLGGTWPAWLAGRAVSAATGHVPGPVHLDVAFREPLWDPEADAAVTASPPPATLPPRVLRAAPRLEPEHLDALAERCARAERGVIVAGPGALALAPAAERRAARAVVALARRLGWPLLAEPCSGLRFPSSEVTVSSYDLLLRSPDFARRGPDLVLRLGAHPVSKPLARWLSDHASGRAVLVDPAGRWRDPLRVADTLAVADAGRLSEDLLAALGPPAPGARPARAWLHRWRQADEAIQQRVEAACARAWEGAVARAAVAAMPDGGLLHVASSLALRDVDALSPPRSGPLRVLASRGLNGIDGTLAQAIGETLAWPHGPALLLTGDLAFLHDAGALALAHLLTASAGRARSLTVVLVDNHGGGIFEQLPIAAHPDAFQDCFATPQDTDPAALCAAHRIPCRRAEDLDAVVSALREEIGQPGLRVILVPVDRLRGATRRRALHTAAAQLVWEAGAPPTPARLKEAPCPTSSG
jgi:2-succinyl-5-enolpyruvyl-6-hydroxy-3-cyclohexene-1-carboxylate synthase